MLLNFKITNWACFRETSEFTMEAGPERNANGSIAHIGAASHPIKVLPMAAIYGNNASGKTQFIRALSFLKSLVTEEFKTGHLLPVFPFLFDDRTAKSPTNFVIQFVVNDTIYEFDITLTSKGIEKEFLYVYNTRTTSKYVLFERNNGIVTCCNCGSSDFQKYANGREFDSSRTFLTLLVLFDKNGDKRISDIYDWFEKSLYILSPNSHYLGMEDYCNTSDVSTKTQNYLNRFDSGIDRIEPQTVPLSIFHNDIIDNVNKTIKPGEIVRQIIEDNVYIFNLNDEGTLIAKQLFAIHKTSSGSTISLPMVFESDGTRRMVDLIPAICKLNSQENNHVFVIDEIDRNLHHIVTRTLLEDFLKSCSQKTRTQLIFTTHDLLLMNQDLCRRDEMWVSDKAPDGSASLSDFASFKGLRRDSKIIDLYLGNRLGGVPRNI